MTITAAIPPKTITLFSDSNFTNQINKTGQKARTDFCNVLANMTTTPKSDCF